MSASREKKTRLDLANQGYVDPKIEREAKEKAEAKRSKILYSVIAAVFVLVAVAVLVNKSGIIGRNSTAVTIDGEKFTPAQVDYYYYSSYNNISTSNNASYYGIDTAKSLKEQPLNDMAKMLLGVSDEEITWDQFLRQTAEENLKNSYLISRAAKADGGVDAAEVQAEVDETMKDMIAYAKQQGFTAKEYVKLAYGKNMTVSMLEEMLTMGIYGSHYEQQYLDSRTYDDAQMEAGYQADKQSFDVTNYEYIYFAGTAPTKDADGNTVTPTDVESAAAKEAATANAAAAKARYEAGETLAAIAEDYDNATYTKIDAGRYDGTDMSTWLFDDARVDGESTLVENEPNIHLVVFHSCGRQEYNTVNVRHCLVSVDASGLDSASATYETDLAALKEAAKAEAESLLSEWKNGEATEESFAAMADEHSADSPEGGLYEQVYQGQMVDTFNDWCFDAGRQTGDTDIVETNYGFHIMYFVGTDLPYWQVQVCTAMKNDEMTAWRDDLLGDITVMEESGIKYVGR